jgi:hypothetical protein
MLTVVATNVLTSSATSSVASSSFVPITPCRLFDTRPGSDNVGTRATPLSANDTLPALVWGINGNCNIPATATGVSMNVTAIGPTASSFLTVFPTDKPRPLTASLNWAAGQAPTPNAVTAALSADGHVSFYNLSGVVNLTADVVGYYEPTSAGPPGPKGDPGDPGPKGDPGDPGPHPTNVVWVAPAGGDFTSVNDALASITDNDTSHPYVIKIAPGTYTEAGGIDMKDFVDIEGSGQDVTTITCACGSATSPASADGASATLRATGPNLHSEVRQITVVNTGSDIYSTAIWTYLVGARTLTFTGVTAQASGGDGNYGIWNQNSSPTMRDLVATSTGDNSTSTEGFAVTIVGSNYDNSTTWAMDRVTARATGAKSAIGVRVTNSTSLVRTTRVDALAISYAGTGASSAGFVADSARLFVDSGSGQAGATATGAVGYGIYAVTGSQLVATNSLLIGFTRAIFTDNPSSSTVSRSTIGGGSSGAGVYRCSYNIDLQGVALAGC